jgi:hypothetical protein
MKLLINLQDVFWKAYRRCAILLIHIKWSAWNPWAVGAMNLAWSKYVKTPMYEGRVEVDREFATNQPNYKGNFPFEAFINYKEFDFFYKQRTWLDRIRLFVAPFSFGDRFRIPLWRMWLWWFGIDEKDLI